MAQRVIIPRLGQTMTEGIVAKWYVKDGDAVLAGDDIYELEYDKSTAAVQAKKAGVVRLIVEEGATVPLGDTVAVILEANERLEDILAQKTYAVANAAKGDALTQSAASVAAAPAARKAEGGHVSASPLVKRLAAENNVELSQVTPSSLDGRISKEDLLKFIEERKNAPAAPAAPCGAPAAQGECSYHVSPMARKLAEELGVDLSRVTPEDGRRIRKEDVTAYAATAPKESPKAQAAAPAAPAAKTISPVLTNRPAEKRREPMRGMRKVICERMSESYFRYPTVTLTTDCDMSYLMTLRKKLNAELDKDGVKLTITDMLLKAVAFSLRDNEIINTSIDGNELVYYDEINVGMAVALDAGLIVPVIKNADKLTLPELSKETKRVAGAARNGTITPDDMSGGTFTVTNLGSFGIDCFNPIINIPESAILGVGRTVEKPCVVDGKLEIRPRAVLSITHDHRVIDGVPAAKFLQSVVHYIEQPELLLEK